MLRLLPTLAAIGMLAEAAAGCSDSALPTSYLGPIDAGGTISEASADQQVVPTPATLTLTACAGGGLLGADELSVVRSLGLLGDRAVVTSANGVSMWNADASGCPTDRVAGFGTDGTVAMDVTSAGIVPGGRVVLATGTSMALLDASGATIGACKTSGKDTAARSVSMGTNGKGVALFSRSPVYAITTDLAYPTACDGTAVTLQPAPFAIAAAAPRFDGSGWVTVEQVTASSPLVVAWYGNDGKRAGATDGVVPGRLCSAAGIVDTERGAVVADSACERVMVFDRGTLFATGEASIDGTPRGIAATGVGTVVVAVAHGVKDGAIATFEVVTLP